VNGFKRTLLKKDRLPWTATLVSMAFWFLLHDSGSAAEASATEAETLFSELVLPALESRCYDCHAETSDRIKGGLLLDREAGLLRGGDTGPAVVPGDPARSLLVQAIKHQEFEMPPKGGRLSDATIAGIERWIELGAPDPRDAPLISTGSQVDYEKGRQHWAFQPLRKQGDQKSGDSAIERGIDGFVSNQLLRQGLSMAPPASKSDVLRRLSFDLTGLPPSHEDQGSFFKSASPDAYSRLVDRFLSSPKFGERQSQFWLDVVRFAESEGFEYDRHLPDAWRYRDYVIDAFNSDKPFDRFLTEQLAGDELESPSTESLSAAIFHRLGAVRRNAGNPDIALSRNEVLTERTDVIGAAVLGLTIGCARCHDHKFDPISQKDYYQLQAYLAATKEVNVDLASKTELEEWTEKSNALDKKMKSLKRRQSRAKGDEKERISLAIEVLESTRPSDLPKIPTIQNDLEKATTMHVLKRGAWELKGELVGMKPLDVLIGEEGAGDSIESVNPRSKLAEWLTDPSHPLTARVIVNRIWQQYFGVGIVATANDFGRNGAKPSHPELLDFLASELIRRNWQLKPIHRMIVMSQAYRQSARVEASSIATRMDPDNRLLWRHSKRRLTGEELRDSMLWASGLLNENQGGKSVLLPVEEDLVKLLYKPDQWQVTRDPAEHNRRSVYLIAKRNLRLPFMEAFDQPALLTSCFRRESSTHAPQALELLNGQISNRLAAFLSERITRSNESPRSVARAGYRFALGREPSEAELSHAVPFLEGGSAKEFALALFNLNEFLYVF
jgi:hypothetical protein